MKVNKVILDIVSIKQLGTYAKKYSTEQSWN